MNYDANERLVEEFLRPLRDVEPVVRRPGRERSRSRWWNVLDVAAVVVVVGLIVGVIAVARHSVGQPAASSGPRTNVLSYLSNDNIVTRPVFGGRERVLVVDNRIRVFEWSPDGQDVAYITATGNEPVQCELRVRDMDSHATDVVATWRQESGPDCGEWDSSEVDSVRWSPNGRYIAVTRTGNVLVVDLATHTSHVVGATLSPQLTWWPGGRVAFLCKNGGFTWCAVRPDGSGRTTLRQHLDFVTWSPAANRIAFIRDPEVNGKLHIQVWTARPDGSDQRLLTTQHAVCCVAIFPTLTWSADGTQLALTTLEADVIDAGTGAAHRVAWWDPITRGAALRWRSQP